jgi:hypothetical protein
MQSEQVWCHGDLLLDEIQFINHLHYFMQLPEAIGAIVLFEILMACSTLNDQQSTDENY